MKCKRIDTSILIADTTREEREQIVAESIGNIDGLCDGCCPGLIKMYQDYIEGHKELREINVPTEQTTVEQTRRNIQENPYVASLHMIEQTQ